jgi:peptidoglycan/LPS O-acetylase OafA/YrhL
VNALGGAVATPRYEALDALRGLCALCVCLYHFNAMGPIGSAAFVRGSWFFVDFFFVLSGFVITANYRDRLIGTMPLKAFTILRFGRVYPLHFVVLMAFLVIEVARLLMPGGGQPAFTGANSLFALFTNLTFMQSFGLHDTLTWNFPSWSIATEFWTYLLFAGAARLAGQSLDRWLVVAIGFCVAVLAAATPEGIHVNQDWGMFRCVYGFAVGSLCWRLWDARGAAVRDIGGWAATMFEVAVVAVVVVFVSLAGAAPANLAAPLVFGLAVLVFAREGGSVSRLLVTRPLLRLGAWSYSIYMVHILVQSRLHHLVGPLGRVLGTPLLTTADQGGRGTITFGTTALQGGLLTGLMLVVVIIVAAITYRTVELPCLRWARRLAARG